MNASNADGTYCPVSIELMVWRVTPASAASCSCEIACSARATFRRFSSFGVPIEPSWRL